MQKSLKHFFNQAVSAQKSGQHKRAHNLYIELLKKDPLHPTANFNLGLLFIGANSVDNALPFLKKAHRLRPENIKFLHNYVVALVQLGRLDELAGVMQHAKSCGAQGTEYDELSVVVDRLIHQEPVENALRAVQANPSEPLNHYNLGIAFLENGDINSAISSYKNSIKLDPNYANSHFNLGNAYKQNQQLDLARKSLENAIKIRPNYIKAFINLGNVLLEQGEPELAIKCYSDALKSDPRSVDSYCGIGAALIEKNEFNLAIKSCHDALGIDPLSIRAYKILAEAHKRVGELGSSKLTLNKALQIQPQNAELYYDLGVTQHELHDFDGAIESYKSAIAIKPNFIQAFNNIGASFSQKGEIEKAMKYFRKALQLDSVSIDAHINLAVSFHDNKDFMKAMGYYNKALSLRPACPDTQMKMALSALCLENFNVAWDLYEGRLKTAQGLGSYLKTSKPAWQPTDTKKTLVWGEQGIGDVISFSSIIPEIYKQSSGLTVRVDQRLVTLFKRSFPNDIKFHPDNEILLEDNYDVHIPIGSLPKYFRRTTDQFKKTAVGWLTADEERAAHLRSSLVSKSDTILIGISWTSKSKLKSAKNPEISLIELAKALQRSNVQLVSLQYGDVTKELEDLQNELSIEVMTVPDIDNREDIDGLSALIKGCDQVVTIDNVTAHLAGALGKKTTALLEYSYDWRWRQADSSSLWYNSVNTLKQSDIGNWSSVVDNLWDAEKVHLGR